MKGVKEGLKVLGGMTVAEHPELLALCRSPAIERYDRLAIRDLARQIERDFMGDAAQKYTDCEHCREEISDGETNTCMGLTCSRALCHRCAEPGNHDCGGSAL